MISVTILFMSIYTVLPYLKPGIPVISSLNNNTVWWAISLLILLLFFFSRYYFFDQTNKDAMLIVWIYLLWNIVCIARGIFETGMTLDGRELTNKMLVLLLPIIIFSATNKIVVQSIFVFYVKYALPLFALIALIVSPDAFGYYLMPVGILILFFPAFSKRQAIFILLLILLVILTDFTTKNHLLIFGIPFIILVIYYLRQKISVRVIELVCISLFVLPLLFIMLVATNLFNIPEINEYYGTSKNNVSTGNESSSAASGIAAGTKTFIYTDVLETAIKNNSWLLGRTPAKGEDPVTISAMTTGFTGMNEQPSNETGLTNLFIWTGLMGLILYFFIFIRASFLAVNRSNNIYIKMLGVFIAFRWLYSWFEEVSNFSVNNFLLMIVLGMCFSNSFRKMTDNEMLVWVRGIFDVRFIRLQYAMMKRNEYEMKLDMNPGIAEEDKNRFV